MLLYQSKHSGAEEDISFFHLRECIFIPHLHRSMELVYVKKGRMELSVFNRIYHLEKYDFALVLPFEIHNFRIYEDSEAYFTVFSLEHIPYFTKMVHGKYLGNPVFRFSDSITKEMETCLFHKVSNLFLFESYLYLCCSELMKCTELIEQDKKEYHLLHRILNYSQEHFMEEDLTLTRIASEFGYNKQYIARYIKEALAGMTFSDFLNEIRINYAVYLLSTTDTCITEVSFQCGYSTIRSFNRNFYKIVKLSPSEVRKKYLLSD